MTSHQEILQEYKHDGSTPYLPYDRIYTTPAGTILLHDNCSAEFVDQLHADEGLVALMRLPEREYALLQRVAENENCSLALAYTPAGTIVGQVTLAPADDWWGRLACASEVAYEVSANWRGLGIGNQLLDLVSTRQDLEDKILLAMGLSWHWDTKGLGLSYWQYREMLIRKVQAYGFREYLTSEPNIREDPTNVLLVRLGKSLDKQTLSQFYECL